MNIFNALRKLVGSTGKKEVLSNFNNATMGSLSQIPYEIILYTLLFCTPKELCTNVCLTNHSFNAIIQCSNTLWRQLHQIYAVCEDMVPPHILAATQDPGDNSSAASTTTSGASSSVQEKKEKKSIWKQLFSELKLYWELDPSSASKRMAVSKNGMEVTYKESKKSSPSSTERCTVITKRSISGGGKHFFRVQFNSRQATAVGLCSTANINNAVQNSILYFRDGSIQLDETNKNLRIVNRVRELDGKMMKVYFVVEDNDVVGILVNLDAGTINFFINGEETVYLDGLETKNGEAYHFVLHAPPTSAMKFKVLSSIREESEVGKGAATVEMLAAERARKSSKKRVVAYAAQ